MTKQKKINFVDVNISIPVKFRIALEGNGKFPLSTEEFEKKIVRIVDSSWGDETNFFAEMLKHALVELGQEAVIQAFGSKNYAKYGNEMVSSGENSQTSKAYLATVRDGKKVKVLDVNVRNN